MLSISHIVVTETNHEDSQASDMGEVLGTHRRLGREELPTLLVSVFHVIAGTTNPERSLMVWVPKMSSGHLDRDFHETALGNETRSWLSRFSTRILELIRACRRNNADLAVEVVMPLG